MKPTPILRHPSSIPRCAALRSLGAFAAESRSLLLLWFLCSAVPLTGLAGDPLVISSNLTIPVADPSYDGLDLIVSNAVVSVEGPHSFASLVLTNGAVLTCSGGAPRYGLELEVPGGMAVSRDSKVDVTGKGYPAGAAPPGIPAANGYTGGSHGGWGLNQGAGASNPVYGDYTRPTQAGAGASSYNFESQWNTGSAGGGVIKLKVGTLWLDGSILADGAEMPYWARAGAGAGGSIWITANTLSGTGSIRTAGGVGKASGGGGRVAVWVGDFSGFNTNRITSTMASSGGTGTVYLRNPDDAFGTLIIDGRIGGDGWTPLGLRGMEALPIPDAVVIRGNKAHARTEHAGLVVEFQRGVVVKEEALLTLVGDWEYGGDLLVESKAGVRVEGNCHLGPTASVRLSGGGRLEVTGDLRSDVALDWSGAAVRTDRRLIWAVPFVLTGGSLQAAEMTALAGMTADGATLTTDRLMAPDLVLANKAVLTALGAYPHKLEVEVSGTMSVSAGSKVDVSFQGYSPGRTTGNSTVGAATGTSGGSYGGLGANVGNGMANAPYGDFADPSDWGSGSGPDIPYYAYFVGGPGGGLARIRAGELRLDGSILANGQPKGGEIHGGGGSGGGIRVVTGVFSGGGTITAAGAGGAGGGRVAVYAPDFSQFNTTRITAPGGTGAPDHGDGSVWLVAGRPHTHVQFTLPGRLKVYPTNDLTFHIPTPLTDGLAVQFNNPITAASYSNDKLQIVGPFGSIAPTGIEEVGDRLYRIAFPPQTENGYYRFSLLPALLDIESVELDQNANGTPGEPDDAYNVTLVLDTVPPRVTQHAPSGDVTGTLSNVDVWFSEAMDRATLTPSSVVISNQLGQVIGVRSVQEAGLNRWRFAFLPQTATGLYTVYAKTNATDLAGNPLPAAPQDSASGVAYTGSFNMVPVDLQLTGITVSTDHLWAGDAVTVSWTGRNASGAPLLGNWTDAVYLSINDRWDYRDIRLTTVAHTGGLEQDETYTAEATFFVPGAVAGNYHFVVRADIFNQEHEDVGEADNQAAAGPFPLSVPLLAVNGPAYSGRLTDTRPWQYLVLTLPPGESLRLNLQGQPGAGNELYVSQGTVPSRQEADFRAPGARQYQDLLVSATPAGGTYYVLVYGNHPGELGAFTLLAESGSFFLRAVTPNQASNARPMPATGLYQPIGRVVPHIVTVTGTGFTTDTRVEFLTSGGQVFSPTSIHLVSPSEMTLDLDLPNWPAGVYSLRVSRGTRSFTLPEALTVLQGGRGRLEATLTTPPAVGSAHFGAHRAWLQYQNVGDGPMPSPLFMVRVSFGYITTDRALAMELTRPGVSVESVLARMDPVIQLLGRGSDVTGVLQPGEKVLVPLYYVTPVEAGRDGFEVQWTLAYVTADDVSWQRCVSGCSRVFKDGVWWEECTSDCWGEDWHVDWTGPVRDALRPPSVSGDAWEGVWSNLPVHAGAEWGDYVVALGNRMNYLHTVGQDTTDVGRLWGMTVAEAAAALHPVRTLASATDAVAPAPGLPLVVQRVFANGIIPRHRLGALGRGWSHNWELKAETLSNGDVVLRGPGGSDRYFRRDPNGTFSPEPGDYASLVLADGAIQLTETDRTRWQFRPDGQFDYVQDNNANRVTCGFTADRLTSLEHSSGKRFLLEYDASGKLTRLTDPVGPGDQDDRVTTYEYVGEHLTTVTAPGNRVTRYAYETGTAPALRHALRSVTHPDSTQDHFAYDNQGRLIESAKDCCTAGEPVRFAFDGMGGVTVTDATDRRTTLKYGLEGQLVQVLDGEGRAVNFGYNTNRLLSRLVGPNAEQYRYGYDPRGNLASIEDPLRYLNTFSYEPAFNRLSQVLDARQNGLRYGYDPRGNLTSITYADGSRELFTYDATGNVITSTNRRGNVISYTYNAAGQVTSKDYDTTPDVMDFTYTYDAAGNLTSASSLNPQPSTLNLTYAPATDRLTRIEYPGGQWFTFEYDAVGRRTKRVDQDGNVVTYAYDASGRLDRMTDGSGQMIVDYDYDAAGRLALKTLGNGVRTTYAYNASGQVTNLVNARSDGSLLSSYSYEYDQSGRRTVMRVKQPLPDQPDRSWTESYGYDPLGQLTSVAYSGDATGVQEANTVTYTYDAAGNRTRVQRDGEHGFTDIYVANALNQYTSAGAASFQYDTDGSLTNKTENGVTTTYTYDPENRLIGVAMPADFWTYTYDALGSRVATTHNVLTTRYVSDPVGLGNTAAEYDNDGKLKARYQHGTGLLSRTHATADSVYYTFSAIGHTSEIVDAAEAVLNSYASDPWGVPFATAEEVGNVYRFVGELGVMLDGIGRVYMRARSYQSGTGKFMQEDPIGISGGFNLSHYAANNPVSIVDPSGQRFRCGDISGDEGTSYTLGVTAGYTAGWNLSLLSFTVIGAGINASLTPGGNLPFLFGGFAWVGPSGPSVSAGFEAGFSLAFGEGLTEGWFCGWEWPNTRKSHPPNVPTRYTRSSTSNILRVIDPNDKLAPDGYGSVAFLAPGRPLTYQIRFENKPEATAPAKLISVTDVLDPNLDLSTLLLTEITFADQVIAIPDGLNRYATTVPFTAGPNQIMAEIEVALDVPSRTLGLTIRAIDPETGWYPEDARVGILYPEDGTGIGQGSISYLVSPRQGLPTGTTITNRARIVFDFNDPIDTPQVLNTLDAGAPSSHVLPIPTPDLGANTFLVTWTGEDDAVGSGIESYDIHVSPDGVHYSRWLQGVTDNSATFSGAPGATYQFFSVARDHVGNVEPPPNSPDAVVAIPADLGNVPPMARDDGVEREWDAPCRVAILKLLANDEDPDGDILGFRSFDRVSPAGASVMEQAGDLIYTPPDRFNAPDSFTYTISDGRGGAATATVHVTVAGELPPNLHVIHILPVAGGGFKITFAGIPGRTYVIQATSDIVNVLWEPVATRVAGANGMFDFEDTADYSIRFYRIVAAP